MTVLRLTAILAAMLLALAACAEDEEPAADPDDDAAADEADDEEPAADPDDDAATDAAEDDWPEEITYAVVPGEGDEGLEEGYDGIITLLEEEIDVEIEFVTATDIAGVIEALIAGTADIAHMGPFGYVIARDQGAEVEPIGATVRGPDMEPDNESLGFARADNDEISDLEDLIGRDVCFTDPGSTTGYLYPAAEFLAMGYEPEEDMTVQFTGQHDAAVLSVLEGDCEAGFSFVGMVEDILPGEGAIDLDDLNIFWRQSVESGGLFMSTNLPQSLQDALRDEILALDGDLLYERGLCGEAWVQEEGPTGDPSCTLDHAGSWGYYPVDDEYFDSLRRVCEETDAPACAE